MLEVCAHVLRLPRPKDGVVARGGGRRLVVQGVQCEVARLPGSTGLGEGPAPL